MSCATLASLDMCPDRTVVRLDPRLIRLGFVVVPIGRSIRQYWHSAHDCAAEGGRSPKNNETPGVDAGGFEGYEVTDERIATTPP